MELSFNVPAIECPESRLFTYPTRTADTWVSRIETVVEGPLALEPTRLTFRITKGSTDLLGIHAWTRNPIRRVRRHVAPLDLGEALVFDCRREVLSNYSLFISNVVEPLLILRNLLREHGEDEHRLVALFHSRTPTYTKEICDRLDVRWIASDAEAHGRIVAQTVEPAHAAPFVFLPSLFPPLELDTDPAPERVFINRKQTRTLINEDEIVRFLEAQGFVSCTFEGMPSRAQWAMLSRAREIVAIHGAGMINLMFNQLWRHGEQTRVVEIFPAAYRIRYFRYLTAALRGRWCAVRSQVTPDVVRDLDERALAMRHAYDAIRVHVDSLAEALQYVRS